MEPEPAPAEPVRPSQLICDHGKNWYQFCEHCDSWDDPEDYDEETLEY